MSSMPENNTASQTTTFNLPPSFEQLASGASSSDNTNWFGRTVTYISDSFCQITNLFSNAISGLTSSIPSFSSILRCIASGLLPDPRMRAAARRAAAQNSLQAPYRPLNSGFQILSNAPIKDLLPRPDHTRDFVAKEELKAVSFTSPSTNSYAPLLSAIKTLALNPHLDTFLQVNDTATKKENVEKLKGHLLAIINFLRGDTSQNITEVHLRALLVLFLRIDRDLNLKDSKSLQRTSSNPEALLLNLYKLLGATFDQVKEDILDTFKTNIAKLSLSMPKDEDLVEIAADAKAHFDVDTNKTHKEFRAFLEKIALNDQAEALFSLDPAIDELKADASIEERALHSKRKLFRETLKNSLRALVQKIRKNTPDEKVTIDEQKAIIKLLTLASPQNINLERDTYLALIADYLNLEAPSITKLKKELFVEKCNFSERLLKLPDELAPVNESLIMKQLRNIGSVCYMDSALWMMARFESFNAILQSDLPTSLTGPDLELTRALRQQLIGVVHELRIGNTVKEVHSHTLYQLLRANGWQYPLHTQQDPQELLTFLYTKLLKDNLETPFSFYTIEVMSWQDPTLDTPSIRPTGRKEINYDLQLGPRTVTLDDGPIIDPSISSMEGIFEYNYTTHLPDFKPDPENKKDDVFPAEKVTYFIGDAPKTLSILQKRYVSEVRYVSGERLVQQRRLNGQLPVFNAENAGNITSTLTIPIYKSKDDLSLKETKTYKLKGVICHEGQSLTSGHYTFLSLQKIEKDGEEPVNAWIHYNDMSSRDPKEYLEGGANVAELNELINNEGYYLIYEEDTSVAASVSEVLLENGDDEKGPGPLFPPRASLETSLASGIGDLD